MTRVAFLWSHSLLDWRSGGALTIKAMLEALAAAGLDCHSISMSVFDGDREFALDRLPVPGLAGDRHHGRFLEATVHGVRHALFRTASTRGRNVRHHEADAFMNLAIERLGRLEPDILVCTGGGAFTRELHRRAAAIVPCRVFYLANATFSRRDMFEPFPHVWCPSRALAESYRQRLGIEAEIVPNVFSRDHFLESGSSPTGSGIRRRFITFVTPAPAKGAMQVFGLARLAARERPDLAFAIVTGRAGRERWRFDPGSLPNVSWLRERRDMRPVYRRTSVLLFPSLCFEAAGRVPVEAQLSGIPVLAHDRGGIAEQLNGAGYLFSPPERCVGDYLAVPGEDEVRPWLERIIKLIDDPAAYADASARARQAAAPFHPVNRNRALVERFEQLTRFPGGRRTSA